MPDAEGGLALQELFPESYAETAAWLRREVAANGDSLAQCEQQLQQAVEQDPHFQSLAAGCQVCLPPLAVATRLLLDAAAVLVTFGTWHARILQGFLCQFFMADSGPESFWELLQVCPVCCQVNQTYAFTLFCTEFASL